jgi:hypothetical protein
LAEWPPTFEPAKYRKTHDDFQWFFEASIKTKQALRFLKDIDADDFRD